jgi:hypothetical protein
MDAVGALKGLFERQIDGWEHRNTNKSCRKRAEDRNMRGSGGSGR